MSIAFLSPRFPLTLLDDNSLVSELPILDRSSLLKLPRAERDRILAERAEAMAPEYKLDPDWKEFLGGDFIEY
jgi:hypothetical protein